MILSIEKLKRLRQQKGWSQELLAKASGLSLRTIQRAEKNGNCSPETQLSLSSVFEVSPSEITPVANHPETKWRRKNIMQAGIGVAVIVAMITMLVLLGGGIGLVVDVPSIIFIFLFMYASSVVAFGSEGMIRSVSGLKFIFSSKVEASTSSKRLVQIYNKQICFLYGGAFIGIVIGSISIHGNFEVEWAAEIIHRAYAVNIIVIFWAAIFAEGILRPLVAKFEMAELEN